MGTIKRYHFRTPKGIYVYRACCYENAMKRVMKDFGGEWDYLGYQEKITDKLKYEDYIEAEVDE